MTSHPPGVDLHTIPLFPPPAGITPNFENPPSLAAVATAVVSVVICLEVFFLTVRVYSNVRKFRILKADDCALNEDQIRYRKRANWQGAGMAITAMFLSFGLAFCTLYRKICSFIVPVSYTQSDWQCGHWHVTTGTSRWQRGRLTCRRYRLISTRMEPADRCRRLSL